MKKILSFLLLCLFALALVGCDSINNAINGGDDEANDSLEMTQEQSQEKLEKMESDGYLITFHYSDDEGDSGTFTIGAKGNVVWMLTDGEGAALLEEEASVHYYSYNNEDGYKYESTVQKEQGESYISSYKIASTSWLYWANAYNGQFKKGADAKVAGRNCYTYDLNLGLGGAIGKLAGLSDFGYKVYVDKETGITMKVEFKATVDGESSSFNYEVTEFKTGSAVVAPTLPEPTSDNNMSESYAKARGEFQKVTGILLPELEGLEVDDYPYSEGATSYCFDIIGGEELGYDTFAALKAYLDLSLSSWTCTGPEVEGEYTNYNYTNDNAWIGLTWDSVNEAVYLNAMMENNLQ
ncbi:MAG: hypothetical protein J5691_07310 [Bacilli bacterium]|nr:hypothetical protein [Bacilli bacterium]